MNPNLNSHLGIHHHHHHHPSHHPSSQLQQSSSHSLHSLHHLHPPSSHAPVHTSPAHLVHHHHHHHPSQRPPDVFTEPADSIDRHQVQARSNIEHYKSSATPAFRGYIQSTHDALILFNACDSGICPKVTRRLHERERRSIDSGAVYVFDEAEAGIKRWTDGRMWSPSRILNNFLVYREIDQKRSPPSNNPSATASTSSNHPTATSQNKRNDDHDESSRSNSIRNTNLLNEQHSNLDHTPLNRPGLISAGSSQRSHQSTIHHHPSSNSNEPPSSNKAEVCHSNDPSSSDPSPALSKDSQEQQPQPTIDNHNLPPSSQGSMNREKERALVGSLTSTYKFRPDGLVKKTISIAGMHMISYYKMEDVLAGRLRTPSSHPKFFPFKIADRFLQPAFFRVPPTWGVSDNGIFWLHDEGPEESAQISNPATTATSLSPGNHHSPSFHNGHRPGALTLANSQSSAPSNSVQGLLSSHPPPPRPNPSERISNSNSALSRPGSSASSTGSPNATSPVSSHAFPLLSTSNLNPPSGPSLSPVMNTVSGRPNFPRVQASTTPSTTSTPNPINRPSVPGTTSARYEPYPRPNRSPPLSATSTANPGVLSDHQPPVSYYTQSHTTSSVNGYPNHSFLSDSHSSSLVSQAQSSHERSNSRPHTITHDSRGLDSIGQVTYGDSGSYRSTPSGGESLYAQYNGSEPVHNSPRSASVPPSPYGLPSITSIGTTGSQVSSTTTNSSTRNVANYHFSTSPAQQQQTTRLSSSTGSHGGSYGAYISPASNTFNSSSHTTSSMNNPSIQTSAVSSTQQNSFLYHSPSAPPSATSATFPSTYPFSTAIQQASNTTRRGSAMATISGEVNDDNSEAVNRDGLRVGGGLSRLNGHGLHQGEDKSAATHWSQIGSSQVMKTEEGGSG